VKNLIVITICCLVFIVCLSSSSQAQRGPASSTQTKPTDLTGSWGGLHLAMSVTTTGASLEFDCAHGEFDKPLRRDTRGRFSVRGTYMQERGGPVRSGEVRKSQAAVYTGTIKGTRMTISVRLADTDHRIGTFSVGRDQPARLFKCK
jgi:hypothetical protein